MPTSNKSITIDINRPVIEDITAKQNDINSRFLTARIVDGSLPVDLSDSTVQLFGVKPGANIFYNYGEILDAPTGQVEIPLTSQMLAVAGTVKAELVITGSDRTVLSSQILKITVDPSLRDDSAIESTNEYTALTESMVETSKQINALKQMQDEINARFGKEAIVNWLYPVGSIYQSENSTSPEELFGGIWESFGEGKMLVGVDSSDSDFSTVGKTGGEKAHTLTPTEIPSRSTGDLEGNSPSGFGVTTSPAYSNRVMVSYSDASAWAAHNNMPPYITVYRWKRVA